MVGMRMFVGCFGMDEQHSEKLKDPKMTTENNPYFDGRPDAEDLIVKRNTKRLYRDAELRSCPVNGHVYEGMMSMRYKEGD